MATTAPTSTSTAPAPAPSVPATRAPADAPLARRPRPAKVVRPPTQRAASRALRRSATPTTGRTWRRAALPEPVRATAGVPVSEAVISCTLVALVFVPVALFTGFSPWTFAAAGVAVAALAYVLWARRVVLGDTYVAVRQLGRYHVATVDHLRHLELKPSEHGGVLCVHTDDGRCMRLRRVELAHPEVNAALRALWRRSDDGTHDSHVARLLELPQDSGRLRHRYLADVRA